MTSSPPPEPPTLRSFSTGAPPTRRSYSCYNCSHSFYITPATVSPPPTSFRCPRCYQRHLIPHHTVVVPPPPPPPAPVAVETSDSPPGIFTYYFSDDFESDYEEYDSDSFSFPPLPNNYQITASTLQSLIDSLKVKSFSPKSTEQAQSCSICMDDFTIESKSCEPYDVVLELPCRHCFHKKCIKEWLSRSNTCPMCRYKLPIERLIDNNNNHGMPPFWPQYDDVLEFHLDQGAIEEMNTNPVREPPIRRVNAELSLTAIAEAHASGSDWRVVSTNGGGRSRWFDPMHDEDGDTFMMDA